jgi:hypothetical protein
MIIIVDDTFVNRYKYHDVDYLKLEKYFNVCKVFDIVKTKDISEILKLLPECRVFCNHKTLQLYNNTEKALSVENNTEYRESLLNRVDVLSIPRIEFSRGLETNMVANKIDKDLFYTNLRCFLDFYIENRVAEVKVLFWGENFEERARMTAIQNMLIQIRMNEMSDYKSNPVIENGIKLLYPGEDYNFIIEKWLVVGLSKNDIIFEINKKI